jgi:hypothetical protein
MKVEKIRDLTLINIDEKKIMIIACDSCGGVGLKENDVLKVSPFYVGAFTVRVAMMEVMCTGAEIVTVVDAVCNEMEHTGSEIIKGIKHELKKAEVEEVVLTGSTEENFSTYTTGLGVTVIGLTQNKNLKLKMLKGPAVVISIGIPQVGDEINLDTGEGIIDYNTVKYMIGLEGVYEIIPIGSKGILYEAETVAKNYNLTLYIKENENIDIHKSAGPATCVIAFIKKDILKYVQCLKNVNIIGKVEN